VAERDEVRRKATLNVGDQRGATCRRGNGSNEGRDEWSTEAPCEAKSDGRAGELREQLEHASCKTREELDALRAALSAEQLHEQVAQVAQLTQLAQYMHTPQRSGELRGE